MAENGTIRERIRRAAAYFRNQEGVVLTTFNLNGPFLEDQVLPIVLGVDANTLPARRAETHQRLGATPCTVFYDPTAAPKLSGRYRVVARPVPMRGRFFHPKLVVIAGRATDDTTWVYLAVSSANLSLSGWGRNAESFGETWIHSRRQQAWSALDKLLTWLQSRSLGEVGAQAEGVARVLAALNRMPDRDTYDDDPTQLWAGTLNAKFYTSISHPDGLAQFIQGDRPLTPTHLRVYSPYWSEVRDQLAVFNATRTTLFPAMRVDGSSLGLAREQAVSLTDDVAVRRNADDIGTRFWHMKLYAVTFEASTFTVVGSCNFTHAGLVGGGGNVEAALMFDANPDWLPTGNLVDEADFATETVAEEETPSPAPVMIVVAYDWRSHSWRWWLDAGPRQHDFVLYLPGVAPIETHSGTHEYPGDAPPRGSTFTVTFASTNGVTNWEGQIVELNLDFSTRTYGRALSASDILQSWRGRAATWDLGGGALRGEAEEVIDESQEDVSSAFDAVNLYDLYVSMRALRAKLGSLDNHPEAQRALLVGRPDSVMALANLANKDTAALVVRYLVLRDLCSVLREWASLIEPDLLWSAERMADDARQSTHSRLITELGPDASQADDMLDWFEQRLSDLNRRRP